MFSVTTLFLYQGIMISYWLSDISNPQHTKKKKRKEMKTKTFKGNRLWPSLTCISVLSCGRAVGEGCVCVCVCAFVLFVYVFMDHKWEVKNLLLSLWIVQELKKHWSLVGLETGTSQCRKGRGKGIGPGNQNKGYGNLYNCTLLLSWLDLHRSRQFLRNCLRT